jgi:hypothetical protein
VNIELESLWMDRAVPDLRHFPEGTERSYVYTYHDITINSERRKRKFRWIGDTLIKEDGEVPKAAILWNPQGNRKRGSLRNSWRRSVIKEAGRSWNELRFLAADRQKWKGLIDSLCS